ncbi:MAG: M20/M25/M40 family metallo-hydrolase [Armatimonadetes bacterium]|nr:M20/M25/M40 family metallo-hydrolase [Armatimonadota bacterium]
MVAEFHRALVETPSVSHDETAVADVAEAFFRDHGVWVERWENNVVARAGSGPKLLFNTHLDTVPPTPSWTDDPWKIRRDGDKVIGLGSNDAKASAACMALALLEVAKSGGPCEVTLTLVQEEETGGRGTEVVWPRLQQSGYRPEGIVVGEPTGLAVGTSQKGMLVLELVSRGQACHAANAAELGAVNPVWGLAADLVALQGVSLGPEHPQLGKTTLQPTSLSAAEARNQVSDVAQCVLDIRSVPGVLHEEIVELLRAHVSGEIRARSIRLQPYQCPEDAVVVRAALSAGGRGTFGSRTMSDQVFFAGWPAIKCGPGDTARSHTADEYVLESELEEGLMFYNQLVKEFAAHA